jgi:hypothetical protein
MVAEPPECGAKLNAHLDFQCLECGRKVESYEGAWFSGGRICVECYHRKDERRCARCFRKLESWQGRVFSDGCEYCEPCFLLLSSVNGRGAWGEQFAFS